MICENIVEVVVPTKWDYKLLKVQCGSHLSLDQGVECGKHPQTQTFRCHLCGVGGFQSQSNLELHWEIDCDRGIKE